MEDEYRDELNSLLEILEDRLICSYCGDPATDREHAIPRWWGGKLTIPSCSECNSLAGNKLFKSLMERRKYIKSRIEAKYAKLLAAPEWDRAEIRELGPNLRRAVQDQEEARQIVVQRLQFFDEMDKLTETFDRLSKERKVITEP